MGVEPKNREGSGRKGIRTEGAERTKVLRQEKPGAFRDNTKAKLAGGERVREGPWGARVERQSREQQGAVGTWALILRGQNVGGVERGSDPLRSPFYKACLASAVGRRRLTRDSSKGTPAAAQTPSPAPSPALAGASLQFWLQSPASVGAVATSHLVHFHTTAPSGPSRLPDCSLQPASWILTPA